MSFPCRRGRNAVPVYSHRGSFSFVLFSQTVFTDPQQLAVVCTKSALKSLKVATTLVHDCQKVVDYQKITHKSIVIIMHFHCEPFSSQQLARYCGFQQVAQTCKGLGNYVTGPLETQGAVGTDCFAQYVLPQQLMDTLLYRWLNIDVVLLIITI